MKENKFLKKFLILLAVLAVLLLAVFVYVYFDIKNRNENVYILNSDLATEIQKQEYMSSMEKLVNDSEGDVGLMNNSVIKSDGSVVFIENIENLAKDNNLSIKIDSLQYEDNTQASSSGMTTLKVSASASGGWRDSYNFLTQIESLPFKVKVNNYSLESSNDRMEIAPNKYSNDKVWQSRFDINVLKYK
jgi:hypothetical protein